MMQGISRGFLGYRRLELAIIQEAYARQRLTSATMSWTKYLPSAP